MLDANILADVYFHLTGGQSKFEFESNHALDSGINDANSDLDDTDIQIHSFNATEEDIKANQERINEIESKYEIRSFGTNHDNHSICTKPYRNITYWRS